MRYKKRLKCNKYVYCRKGKLGFRLPEEKILPWQVNYLDLELSRNNVGYARFALIAGLLRGSIEQRKIIINVITPNFLPPKSFEWYIYEYLFNVLNSIPDATIRVENLTAKIPAFFQVIWNETPTKHAMFGELLNLAIALKLNPSDSELDKATQLVQMVAKREGYVGP